MKKIIISLCLLYAADSSAMAAAKIVGLAMSPVLVPATVCAIQTLAAQERVRDHLRIDKEIQEMSPENRAIEKFCLMSNANSLRVCVDGIYAGVCPGINVAKLAGTSSVGYPSVQHMKPAGQVGFFAGLSLYATIPLAQIALSLLKKVK